MKKFGLALLVVVALLAGVAVLCTMPFSDVPKGAPVLTQQTTGVVLSKSDGGVVLRTSENGVAVLHMLLTTKDVADMLLVGDIVRVEIQLVIDSTETLCSAEVLMRGGTAKEPGALLPNLPEQSSAAVDAFKPIVPKVIE